MSRMARLGLHVGALLCVVACRTKSPLPPPDPEHDLVVDGGVFTYNGKELRMYEPLERWIDALGPPLHRYAYPSYEECEWDLPISVRASTTPDRRAYVDDVQILFDKQGESLFPGRLVVQGLVFPKGSAFRWDIGEGPVLEVLVGDNTSATVETKRCGNVFVDAHIGLTAVVPRFVNRLHFVAQWPK